MSNASKCSRMQTQKRRTKDFTPLTEKVKLACSLGFNISSNASLACDNLTSTVAYPAGCVLVLHNLQNDEQVHIQSPFKKSISALAFSTDGKLLVTGECGHNPMTRVWDIQARMQIAEFSGHTNGINCVAFSPNLKYVVSIGSQHDMIVNVWEWKQDKKIASNKVSSKVKSLAFSSDGKYFVTVGNRHAKFWYLHYSRNSRALIDTVPLMGRSAILGDHGNCYFRCVGTGVDQMSEFTYAVTKTGILCEFNSRRIIERHVKLKTDCANCLHVGKHIIFIGCSDGVVFGYNPTNQSVIMLPQPHSLGVDIAQGLIGSFPVHEATSISPHTMALTFDQTHNKLVCVYSDHSMYVWDIQNLSKVKKYSSFLYHSGCIWGIEMYPDNIENPALPPGSFVTCSNDDTIRIWNLNSSIRTNIYSAQLLKVFYTDVNLGFICDLTFNSQNLDTVYDSMNGVRCLKIDPTGSHLATGDRSGIIRIYDLYAMSEIIKMEVHVGEVLSLAYTSTECGKKLLASSSRDRFIHVFDVAKNYEKIQTVFGHSSSITAVCFVFRKNNLYLISCSADKSIIFRQLDTAQDSFIRHYNVVCKSSLYDMEVDLENQNLLTVSMDRLIRLYSVSGSNKCIRSFKGSEGDTGSLLKVILDPSALLVATSCTDKNIYIYCYQTGECVAILYGHAEIITGITFSNDSQKLISVSGDGCMFVWSIPPELTKCYVKKQRRTLPLSKSLQNIDQTLKHPEEEKVSEGFSMNSPKYTFSVCNLPLWAKKQVKDVLSSSFNDSPEKEVPLGPRGRWAQKLNDKPLVLHNYLDSESLLTPPLTNNWESYAVQDNSTDMTNESLDNCNESTSSSKKDDTFTLSNGSSDQTVIYVAPKMNGVDGEEEGIESELGSSDEFYLVLDDKKEGPSDIEERSALVPEGEAYSEDEDGIITPLEDNPFTLSTENLECVDQRERFLKSSYENFDNSFLRGSEKQHSFSGKVFNKMCGDTTYSFNRSNSSHSSQTEKNNSRAELSKALQDTKKMLSSATLKEGGSIKNSKSTTNIHSQSFESAPSFPKKTFRKDLRRTTSLATLSLPPIYFEKAYSNGFEKGNSFSASQMDLHKGQAISTPQASNSLLNLPDLYYSPIENVTPNVSLQRATSTTLLSSKPNSMSRSSSIGNMKHTISARSIDWDMEAHGQITFNTCQDMVKNLTDIANTISHTYQLLNSFNCEESNTMKGILNFGVNQANEILNSVVSKDDALLNDPRILSLLQKYSEKLVDQLTPR